MTQMQLKPKTKSVPTNADDWKSFRYQFDDLFDRFMGRLDTFAIKPLSELEHGWFDNFRKSASPAIEIADTDKAYSVNIELPGVDEKDVHVSVSDGILVIKGEKRQAHEEKDENRYFSERSYGAFQRSFALPKGTDESKLEANMHNGVLSVTVPKTACTPARKIDVKKT